MSSGSWPRSPVRSSSFPFVDNQAVRAGDLLFEIDPRPFRDRGRAGPGGAGPAPDRTSRPSPTPSPAPRPASATPRPSSGSRRPSGGASSRSRRSARFPSRIATRPRRRSTARARARQRKGRARPGPGQPRRGRRQQPGDPGRGRRARERRARAQLRHRRGPGERPRHGSRPEPGQLCQRREPDALAGQHRQLAGGGLLQGDPARTHPAGAAGGRLPARLPRRALRRLGAGHRLGRRAAGRRRRARPVGSPERDARPSTGCAWPSASRCASRCRTPIRPIRCARACAPRSASTPRRRRAGADPTATEPTWPRPFIPLPRLRERRRPSRPRRGAAYAIRFGVAVSAAIWIGKARAWSRTTRPGS